MSLAKMYAAKFKLRTAAAIFKIAGRDLSKPIGNRAKSVIGVTEENLPANRKRLIGIKFSKYHQIPAAEGNKLGASWKPKYLELLEKTESAQDLINEL